MPTSTDTADIFNGGTVTITTTGNDCQEVFLDSPGAGSSIQMTNGSFSGYIDAGASGAGTFAQSGGTVSTYGIYMSVGGSGTYSLSGTGQLIATSEEIGITSAGSFVQYGGTNTVAAHVYLGEYAGAAGHYTLSGGLLTVQGGTDGECVGYSGSGSFVQSGGTNIDASPLSLGCYPGSTGTYNLSAGGSLSALTENVGLSGAGTFTQSSGTNATSTLAVGPNGRYTVSGGSLGVSYGFANAGLFDAGNTAVTLGSTASACILDFSTGTLLNVGNMSVAAGANSLVILPQGFSTSAFKSYSNAGVTLTAGSNVTLSPGQVVNGWGAVNSPIVCQGTIAAATSESINLYGGLSMSGTANVSLGSGTLVTNKNSSGMTGGSLTAAAHCIGLSGAGTFTQSGGTNSSSIVYLGYYAGDNGTYVLNGNGVLQPFVACRRVQWLGDSKSVGWHSRRQRLCRISTRQHWRLQP